MSDGEAGDVVEDMNPANDHSFYHYRKASVLNLNFPSSPSSAAGFGNVEVVRSGWLHKQGGAKGGRKSWYSNHN
jgi:hypothetical protein